MLNAKYTECLNLAERLKAQVKQVNPMSVSTSMMRSTNKFYELLVGGAKHLGTLGVAAEMSRQPTAVRYYSQAVILLEMALLPDDQRPLTPQQREHVLQILRETRERLRVASAPSTPVSTSM